MDKINNITVNGVTYEVGGTGGGSGIDIYYIPTKIRELSNGASKSDFDIALGGTGDGSKIKELVEAVHSGKMVMLKNPTTGAIMPVNSISETATNVYIQFSYINAGSSIPYLFNIGISIAGSILVVVFKRYKITGEEA